MANTPRESARRPGLRIFNRSVRLGILPAVAHCLQPFLGFLLQFSRKRTGYEPELTRDRIQVSTTKPHTAVRLRSNENRHPLPLQSNVANLIQFIFAVRPSGEMTWHVLVSR